MLRTTIYFVTWVAGWPSTKCDMCDTWILKVFLRFISSHKWWQGFNSMLWIFCGFVAWSDLNFLKSSQTLTFYLVLSTVRSLKRFNIWSHVFCECGLKKIFKSKLSFFGLKTNSRVQCMDTVGQQLFLRFFLQIYLWHFSSDLFGWRQR